MSIITPTAADAGQVQLKTSEIERIRRMTDSERDFTRAACAELLALPIYPTLSLDAVDRICDAIAAF